MAKKQQAPTPTDAVPDIPFDPDETEAAIPWKNRIVGFEASVDPSQLTPDPENPREHPEYQKAAVRGSLNELGWIDAVKFNVRTGKLFDGHERVAEALEKGEKVPVLYVDMNEDEHRLALATFDPLTNLASYGDASKLNALLEQTTTSSDALAQVLSELQITHEPSFENKGQSGDRQIERATTVRIVLHVDQVKLVERALTSTGLDDRGKALEVICREFTERKFDALPAADTTTGDDADHVE